MKQKKQTATALRNLLNSIKPVNHNHTASPKAPQKERLRQKQKQKQQRHKKEQQQQEKQKLRSCYYPDDDDDRHHHHHHDLDDEDDDLVRTHFPDFHLDPHAADDSEYLDDDSDADDDNDNDQDLLVEVRKEAFHRKVDEDVAVFVKLAEQMSLESLIFLLQGQARAQNLPQKEYLEEYKKKQHQQHDSILHVVPEEEDSDIKSVESASSSASSINSRNSRNSRNSKNSNNSKHKNQSQNQHKHKQQHPRRRRGRKPPKTKQFRFADVTNNEVRSVIYEIDSIKHLKHDLWWQENEMQDIRQNAIDTVLFYQRHRKDYIESIEQIFDADASSSSNNNNNNINNNNAKDITMLPMLFKKLSQDAFTRGLEGHIVSSLFSNHRSLFCKSVILWQEEIKRESCIIEQEQQQYQKTDNINNNNKDHQLNYCATQLAEACQIHTRFFSEFAIALGQIDHVEALKASMSRWT